VFAPAVPQATRPVGSGHASTVSVRNRYDFAVPPHGAGGAFRSGPAGAAPTWSAGRTDVTAGTAITTVAVLADGRTTGAAVTAHTVSERGVTANAAVTAGAAGGGGFTTCPAARASAPFADQFGGPAATT
jgi:hypothetical protein